MLDVPCARCRSMDIHPFALVGVDSICRVHHVVIFILLCSWSCDGLVMLNAPGARCRSADTLGASCEEVFFSERLVRRLDTRPMEFASFAMQSKCKSIVVSSHSANIPVPIMFSNTV